MQVPEGPISWPLPQHFNTRIDALPGISRSLVDCTTPPSDVTNTVNTTNINHIVYNMAGITLKKNFHWKRQRKLAPRRDLVEQLCLSVPVRAVLSHTALTRSLTKLPSPLHLLPLPTRFVCHPSLPSSLSPSSGMGPRLHRNVFLEQQASMFPVWSLCSAQRGPAPAVPAYTCNLWCLLLLCCARFGEWSQQASEAASAWHGTSWRRRWWKRSGASGGQRGGRANKSTMEWMERPRATAGPQEGGRPGGLGLAWKGFRPWRLQSH